MKKKIISDKNLEQIKVEIEKSFFYRFNHDSHLVEALTHRSFLNSESALNFASNERLEFLGDSIINMLITSELFENYPNSNEGDLSKMKAILVSKKVFAQVASEIQVGQMLLMNKGEEASGGRQRQSVLADAFEAIIGAIYMDSKALDIIAHIIQVYIWSKHQEFIADNEFQNYKSELLELVQKFDNMSPFYRVLSAEGPDHEKKFTVSVSFKDKKLGVGEGLSKKEAEQNAAKNALKAINQGLNPVGN